MTLQSKEPTYYLLQAGGHVQKRETKLTCLIVTNNGGIKQQCAIKTGTIQPEGSVESITLQQHRFNKQKRK